MLVFWGAPVLVNSHRFLWVPPMASPSHYRRLVNTAPNWMNRTNGNNKYYTSWTHFKNLSVQFQEVRVPWNTYRFVEDKLLFGSAANWKCEQNRSLQTPHGTCKRTTASNRLRDLFMFCGLVSLTLISSMAGQMQRGHCQTKGNSMTISMRIYKHFHRFHITESTQWINSLK